ncbi:MAG: DUF5805 domain-containing protein [Halanaeroarchaeum sp.]
MSDDSATERSVVTTYVPAYQKAAWREHADDLGMSQSEFVKTMVQAGRRGFGADVETPDAATPSSTPEPQGSRADDGAPDGFEAQVLSAVENQPYLGWDELVEAVLGDLEGDLEEAVTNLQQRNEITHSPRKGGYVRVED